MQNVPKYNVDPVVVDIRKPKFNYAHLVKFSNLDLSGETIHTKKSSSALKTTLLAFGGCVGVGVVTLTLLAFFNFDRVKAHAIERGNVIAGNIIESAELLKDFNPRAAEEKLKENQVQLGEIESFLRRTKSGTLLGSLGSIVPWAKDMVGLVKGISVFNLNLLQLTGHMRDLEEHGFTYFQENGRALIRGLSETRGLFENLLENTADIRNITTRLESVSSFFARINERISEQYVTYTTQFHLWSDALEGVTTFLDTKVDRHILLIFHNNSEMRPAGGFVGSYGVLTINEGQMASLEVEDIYWPDHDINFTRKIVPPVPLQGVTQDWESRDANWFFDFPTSARTIMGFLESAKIYADASITFDGAIAINTRVLQSLLEFTGPIPIPEYELVIDGTNFLAEIQREVETGKDKEAGGNPKKILSFITPVLMEKLGALSDENASTLFEKIRSHIEHKDIMVYMEDKQIGNLTHTMGVDGSVYALPHNFWGSYLAVVDANIAGGKSDAFIQEEIHARIDLATDGGAFTDLTVTRTHSGEDEEDWWYSAENKNYLQVYTNPESQFVSVEGNTARKNIERVDYDKLGYERNEDLQKIEDTTIFLTEFNAWSQKAFGKAVFATWFNVAAGKEKTLTVRYTTPAGNKLVVEEGRVYRFIFDRQSGTNTSLKATITAPLGYVWEESGAPAYTFETLNPKSREIIDLHLMEN